MKIFSGVICIVYSALLMGQANELSLDQALQKAIENNYDIRIEKNIAQVAKVNNSWTNAGAYPVVTANATPYIALNNLNQKLSNGTDINKSNSLLKTLNANVELNWNVLNGFKLYTTKEKLSTLEKIGELELKSRINQTSYQVIYNYYDLLRLKQQLKSTKEQIAVSEDRLSLSKIRFDVGNTGKSDYLQTQLDLNELRLSAMAIENNIKNSLATLNRIMGNEPGENFSVTDTIILKKLDDLEAIKLRAFSQNPEVLSMQNQLRVGELVKKEIKSAIYPSVNIGAAYSYARSQNQGGFTLLNQTYGPSAQINIAIPLYDGHRVREQLKVADLLIENQKLSNEQLKAEYSTSIYTAYNNYQYALQQAELEKKNLAIANENFSIARARYDKLSITLVEFRQIQYTLIDTYTRMYNAMFNAKIAESDLLLLAGDLVQ